LLAAGCLRNLRSATLHPRSKSVVGSKATIAALAQGLLELPEFETLGWSETAAEGPVSGIGRTVQSIVKLHQDRWLCLSMRAHSTIFKRLNVGAE
jgi:hypothetical protein